jgi:hypothetical protein
MQKLILACGLLGLLAWLFLFLVWATDEIKPRKGGRG